MRRDTDVKHPRAAGAALGGAAAGAWGGRLFEAHCPSLDLVHLALGHVLPIAILALLGALFGQPLGEGAGGESDHFQCDQFGVDRSASCRGTGRWNVQEAAIGASCGLLLLLPSLFSLLLAPSPSLALVGGTWSRAVGWLPTMRTVPT